MRDIKGSALFARKRLITTTAGLTARGPSKLHTEDSSLVQERIQSFHILACEKDLTDLIDLEGVNMNSGDLRGAKGTMAPGQTLFVAEKGPRA